ncbi:MAG: hypothetical protein A2X78_00260 [Gammaproteobacteria bacterium GWE2_37_16]|nr:MAG: hypothetical protein A2X78_00260 [Gammaproteobacteria bacterium GWE2_37_16]
MSRDISIDASTENFSICQCFNEDLENIVDLRIAILRELGIFAPKDEVEIEQMQQKCLEYFCPRIASGEVMVWVIKNANNKIVCIGCVTVYQAPPIVLHSNDKECYIYGIYTVPEFREFGLAGKLTRHIIAELKKQGFRYLWLRASKFGRSIYEKIGFQSRDSVMDLLLAEQKMC